MSRESGLPSCIQRKLISLQVKLLHLTLTDWHKTRRAEAGLGGPCKALEYVDVAARAVRVPHRFLGCDMTIKWPRDFLAFCDHKQSSDRHTRAAHPVVPFHHNRLLKVDGSLLAFAGEANKDPQVHAALVSNIWGAYISGKDVHDKDGEGTDEEGKRDAHDKEAVRKDTQAKDAAGKEKEKPFSNLGSVMIHCEVRCDAMFA